MTKDSKEIDLVVVEIKVPFHLAVTRGDEIRFIQTDFSP